jgi:hypothetical protein
VPVTAKALQLCAPASARPIFMEPMNQGSASALNGTKHAHAGSGNRELREEGRKEGRKEGKKVG